MKRPIIYVMGVIIVAGFWVPAGTATELIWVPKNPSFGGSPYNASWLMSSAQAQNRYVKKSAAYTAPKSDPVADFETRLRSQLLYQLAGKIVNEAFGEEGLLPTDQSEATYSIGTFNVHVVSDLTKITVSLTDTTTGNTTTVEVPYF